jgi:hypothetical protein
MANLRVDKITSTETFETTGSVQFVDADSLQIAANSDFDFGTGDFTVEWWQYLNGKQDEYQTVLSINYGTNPNLTIQSASNTGVVAQKVYVNGTSVTFTEESNTPLSTWVHYALVRNGSGSSNLKIYRDGVQTGQGTYSGDIGSSSITTFIGGHPNVATGVDLQGFISNLRIVKGTALYGSNFKPPMRELEVIPGTVLLACQSKTDATLEKTDKTITVNGNAVASELTPGILTPIVKSGGGSAITGSVEFDGTGDYLSVQSSTDFDFGTGDFTIELYVNLGNLTSRNIFARNDSNPSNTGILLWQNGSSQLQWYSSVGNTTGVITVTTPLTLHEWAHIAVSRESNTTRLFANGVLIGSVSDSTNISGNSALVTGSTFSGDGYYPKGFISNFRINKGTALYTADFIPPTRELKKVPGTVLLCCQDPDNPLTEATGKTITGHGSLGDGSLGPELVTNDSVWTLTKGGSGATDWTVSNSGSSLAGTTVSGGYIRATYTIPKGDYLVSLRWTGGAFAVQDSTGYIVATDGTDTEFGASEDGAYSFYMTATTSVVITGTSWSTAYTVDDISIKRIYKNNGASNFTPQVGDDRKVTFEGVTKIDTDAYFYFPTGDTITRESRSGRGFFAGGGTTPNYTNAIDFITIASMGNAQDFGDLTQEKQSLGGTANSTRGIFASGYNTPTFPATGNNTDRIEYITTATTGNGIDFGNLDSAIRYASCAANSTRGLIAGGYTPTYIDRIEYITIASLGNAQTFGTLTTAGTATDKAGLSSPTRALFAGGEGPSMVSQIDYVTIATLGNAADFGDLTAARRRAASASSGTRGLVANGYNGSAYVNTIDYVTIASTGNAQDFGDSFQARSSSKGQVSSTIRGVFGSGVTPSSTNTIDYVTIASTGNANDFGDTRGALFEQAGCSDSHGGLG